MTIAPSGSPERRWWLLSVPSQLNICEPRQARKGAAAADVRCAGVWLARVASIVVRHA